MQDAAAEVSAADDAEVAGAALVAARLKQGSFLDQVRPPD